MPTTCLRVFLAPFLLSALACSGAQAVAPSDPVDGAAATAASRTGEGARCAESSPGRALHPGAEVIKNGQVLRGLLVSDDPIPTRGGRFRTYQFDADENEYYVVTMRSDDFDAYLSVAQVMGGITDVLATDDDSGGGTDARLRFRAPAAGTYLIIAQSLAREGNGVGAFTLELAEAPPPVEVPPEPISMGQTVQGRLTETSMILENESHYHPYTFSGQAGQRVSITMRSRDFDAFLFLLSKEGESEQLIMTDDDGGGQTDARIRLALPATGSYVIRAAALGPGMGGYELTVEEYVHVPPPPPKPIKLGRTIKGELTGSDPQLEDGSSYHDYVVKVRAGQQLRITMTSTAFDTFVFFGRMVGDTFQPMGMNDDGPDGTNSLLEITVPEAGDYIVRANSHIARQTGPYTLRVEGTGSRP